MKHSVSVRDLTAIGAGAAILAAVSQISVPLPGGVPLTLQCFAVTLLASALGMKRSATAAVVYILLGIAGLPVFAGFRGGAQIVFGATGGFILGFPIMAAITGFFADRRGRFSSLTAAFAGLVADYALGVAFLASATGISLQAAFMAGAAPFIWKDLLLCGAASVAGLKLRTALSRAVA